MYQKLVVVDGVKIWVSCTPETPLSDILRRAATQIERSLLERAAARTDQHIRS